MRGRKPKPTALKELAGNPGKRKSNAQEPSLRRAIPQCPKHLSAEAKREWKRMATELYNAGLLTNIDRSALAAYCQAWARWAQAERILAKKGTVILTSFGNLIQSPYLSIANTAVEQMRKFLTEFGMTPSSRSRVKALPGGSEESLAEILFQKAAARK